MKLNLLCVAFVLLTTAAFSQVDLPQFNNDRIRITKKGMLVLGSWAAANIVVGAIGLSTSQGEAKYFHQMNLVWGTVNLAIAGSTFLGLRKKKSGLSLSQTIQGQSAIEKTFLINSALDLVYLTTGLYCLEKSRNDADPDKYKGYGKSLLIQGGSLLVFDVIMYIANLQHGKQLYKILNQVQFSGNSVGFVWKL
ncbi:MAG: hypothetical protein JWM28_997 [Chitinophagaceae bacterium]|nr:hypothetical protein [Chitinophagaceae bacterium]